MRQNPQVEELAQQVQQSTGELVKVAFVAQGYTGEQAAQAAQEHGIHLAVVKLPEAKKGFVLLPRRWVVERSFWMDESMKAMNTRLRKVGRDIDWLSPCCLYNVDG